jgi:hypothetical protein
MIPFMPWRAAFIANPSVRRNIAPLARFQGSHRGLLERGCDEIALAPQWRALRAAVANLCFLKT